MSKFVLVWILATVPTPPPDQFPAYGEETFAVYADCLAAAKAKQAAIANFAWTDATGVHRIDRSTVYCYDANPWGR